MLDEGQVCRCFHQHSYPYRASCDCPHRHPRALPDIPWPDSRNDGGTERDEIGGLDYRDSRKRRYMVSDRAIPSLRFILAGHDLRSPMSIALPILSPPHLHDGSSRRVSSSASPAVFRSSSSYIGSLPKSELTVSRPTCLSSIVKPASPCPRVPTSSP
jgi:hypothetical protein